MISQIIRDSESPVDLDAVVKATLRDSEMVYYLRTLALIDDFPRYVREHASYTPQV